MRTLRLAVTALLSVVAVSFAHFVAAADTILSAGVPGMQAHRIKEPVFNGHAYVYETGKEHTRSVLLVHGLGDNGARDFAPHVAWLARSYHVVAVDLPGFGQSDKANVPYTPRNYATYLKHVADRFVHRPFMLVGHSMGAVVVLRYATVFPGDVERLVVIDAPGILHRYAFSSRMLEYLDIELTQPVTNTLTKITNFARRLLGGVEQTNLELEAILNSATLREKVLGGSPNRIAGLAVALEDFTGQLGKVTMPTLVIWGAHDPITPVRTGKLLARLLPQVGLAVIEDAAHVPMAQTPDEFRALIESFANDGVPAAEPPRTMVKHGSTQCRQASNRVYQGEYEQLVLNGCTDVLIRNARIKQLRALDSSVTIEDSYLGGGDVALYAERSSAKLTNVDIAGEVAIVADASRFDIAGGQIEAQRVVVRANSPSSVVFSLARLRSPALNGWVHHFYSVTPERPL